MEYKTNIKGITCNIGGMREENPSESAHAATKAANSASAKTTVSGKTGMYQAHVNAWKEHTHAAAFHHEAAGATVNPDKKAIHQDLAKYHDKMATRHQAAYQKMR